MAFLVQIGTTNICNARCTFCFRPNMTRPLGIMADSTFTRIIAENPASNYVLCLFGEPLCDPNIFRRVAELRQLRPHCTIYFHTNGMRLTPARVDKLVEAGLSRLVLSCYGLSEQHDRLQPPAKFGKIVEYAKYAATQLPLMIDSAEVEPMDRVAISTFWKQACNTNVFYDDIVTWSSGEDMTTAKLNDTARCAMLLGHKTFDWDGTETTCCNDFNCRNVDKTYPFCVGCQFEKEFRACTKSSQA